MLESIRRSEGEPLAAEVLDTLRSLRMEHGFFRVIFTGSIGLHHVLKRLTDARIPSSPVQFLVRLFRYGIRYLISRDQAVFAELVEPERQILRQALRLAGDSGEWFFSAAGMASGQAPQGEKGLPVSVTACTSTHGH